MLRQGILTALAALAATLIASAEPPQVKLDVAMGNSSMLANQKQTAYLRVAMTGFTQDNPEKRPPVNVAFVLDKSGSMQGDKIEHAKDAAILAIERLHDDDIISVVVYQSVVEVLVPATKVSDRESIYNEIRAIRADGSTALFAGVSKGAQELRKFLDANRVNRIVLLSDGLANVGPNSPDELGELGISLGAEGIAVSTIGLGADYNEDLMVRLAQSSDGNHMFAEQPSDLETAFNDEFGDVLSVVAQDVDVVIHCTDGIRPVRVIGREADIDGQAIHLSLNQLYSEQTKYIIVEVEGPARAAGESMVVAQAKLTYRNMATETTDSMQAAASIAMTDSPAVVKASLNKDVMESAIRQVGVERYALACDLRDQGRVAEAQQVLSSNSLFLKDNASALKSEKLRVDAVNNDLANSNLDESKWKVQRKVMKEESYQVIKQQKNSR